MVLNEKIAELVQPDTTEQSPEPTATDGCNTTQTETTPEPAFGGEPAGATAASDSAAANACADVDTEHPPDPGAADAKRRALLEVLSARFKVPLNRIVKYTGEPRNINLGGVAGLINQAKLRVSIADATGRYLPSFDSKVWPTIAQGLLDACESVDRGADATLLGTMAEWLRSYLGEKSIHATLELADEAREPFRDGGDVIIFSSDFRRWLQFRLNERVTQNRLTADLRAFGAEPGLFKTVSNGRPTTRSAWRLPPGAWIPVTS